MLLDLQKPVDKFVSSGFPKRYKNEFGYISKMIDIFKWVGIFHTCNMIIENVYGFITVKHIFMDQLYLVSFVCIPYSWLLCKDECIISYMIKKYENPNYILGDEPENAKDIMDLFTNQYQYAIFYHCNHILRIGSLYIVNGRTTHIPHIIFVPTMILYSYYVYDIYYKIHSRKKIYPYFHILFAIYLLLFVKDQIWLLTDNNNISSSVNF